MILISHRGNINGRNPRLENSQSYIQKALDAGYKVELDIFHLDKKYWYGHDNCNCHGEVDWDFVYKNKNNIYIHCKDAETLVAVSGANYNFFSHERDDFVVTSRGEVIAHSSKGESASYFPDDIRGLILMLPEKYGLSKESVKNCAGICSDIIEFYK